MIGRGEVEGGPGASLASSRGRPTLASASDKIESKERSCASAEVSGAWESTSADRGAEGKGADVSLAEGGGDEGRERFGMAIEGIGGDASLASALFDGVVGGRVSALSVVVAAVEGAGRIASVDEGGD